MVAYSLVLSKTFDWIDRSHEEESSVITECIAVQIRVGYFLKQGVGIAHSV
jgi:hypothetical protein